MTMTSDHIEETTAAMDIENLEPPRETTASRIHRMLKSHGKRKKKAALSKTQWIVKRRTSAETWRVAIISVAAVLVALALGTSVVLYGLTQTVDVQLIVDGQAVDRLVQDYIANRSK